MGILNFTYLPFLFSFIFFSFSDERHYSMFAGFVEIIHRKRLILVRKGKTAEQIAEKVRKTRGSETQVKGEGAGEEGVSST